MGLRIEVLSRIPKHDMAMAPKQIHEAHYCWNVGPPPMVDTPPFPLNTLSSSQNVMVKDLHMGRHVYSHSPYTTRQVFQLSTQQLSFGAWQMIIFQNF
jgi:hypothetical protein